MTQCLADDHYPSVGEGVIAMIAGRRQDCRVHARYHDGPFVLFAVTDANGNIHFDLLPHAVSKPTCDAISR